MKGLLREGQLTNVCIEEAEEASRGADETGGACDERAYHSHVLQLPIHCSVVPAF